MTTGIIIDHGSRRAESNLMREELARPFAQRFYLFALSFLPSLLLGALWLHTHRTRRMYNLYDKPPIYYGLETRPGRLIFSRSIFPDPTLNNRPGPVVERKFLGFVYLLTWSYTGPQNPDGSFPHGTLHEFTIPLYAPTLLFALLPLLFLPRLLRTHRHRHRLKHNLCPTCAYDLRASKEICPECGSRIPSPPQSLTSYTIPTTPKNHSCLL